MTSLLTQSTKTIRQKYTPKINISNFVPASQPSSGRPVKCCHFLPIKTIVHTVTWDSSAIPQGVEASALPLSQYDVSNSTKIHGKGYSCRRWACRGVAWHGMAWRGVSLRAVANSPSHRQPSPTTRTEQTPERSR